MQFTPPSLEASVREELLHAEGVTRFTPNRRFATVFTEGGAADNLFFLEAGLVKLHKIGSDSKEIILQILGPGELFGEQVLGSHTVREVGAEVLQEGIIHIIPRDTFINFCDASPQLWRHVSELLIGRKRALEKKIELLCLQDVEFRILYYLGELATALGTRLESNEFAVLLSQGELASLIGATRETTSTTLNALARRGLVRLGRRQLIVPSVEALQNAAHSRAASATAGSSES